MARAGTEPGLLALESDGLPTALHGLVSQNITMLSDLYACKTISTKILFL